MNFSFVLYFVVPLILTAILTVVGVVLLSIDSRRKAKENKVNHKEWVKIGGKVVSSQLGEPKADGSYDPNVKYIYTVKRTEYQGNTVFSGKRADDKKNTAQEILAHFPDNGYVPIHYNPENPSESVLEIHSNSENYVGFFGWLLTGFGVLSLCFTVLMAFIIFRSALSYS